jgi:hypothetical protein
MNAATMAVSLSTEDQLTCEQDCQLANAAFAEGKELATLKRFGLLSYEDYVGWVLQEIGRFC